MNAGLDYIRTVPGILKIVEIGLDVICMICLSIYNFAITSRGGWAMFVAVISLIASLTFLILFLLQLPAKVSAPWPLILIIVYAILTGLQFIAFIVIAVLSSQIVTVGSIIASAIFLFLSFAAYLVDLVFCIMAGRGGIFGSATTGSTATQQQTTVTTTTVTTA